MYINTYTWYIYTILYTHKRMCIHTYIYIWSWQINDPFTSSICYPLLGPPHWEAKPEVAPLGSLVGPGPVTTYPNSWVVSNGQSYSGFPQSIDAPIWGITTAQGLCLQMPKKLKTYTSVPHVSIKKNLTSMFRYVCMYLSMYLSMYLCIHASMYLCMYVCMHACMY